MKAIILALLITVQLPSFSQNKQDLTGEWKVQYSGNKPEELVLQKYSRDSAEFGNWGVFLEFREDGTYAEYASAPCGLDDNHYHYEGKWSYDSVNTTITLNEIKVINGRPNIYQNYKVLEKGKLKVSSFSGNTIQVSILLAWEKTSPKK